MYNASFLVNMKIRLAVCRVAGRCRRDFTHCIVLNETILLGLTSCAYGCYSKVVCCQV